jgi:uncharacterized protein YndB with AHSA1/START domain
MTATSVVHDTISVERRLAGVDAATVFEAWADPTLRIQWDNPGENFVVTEHTQDFRVGGRQTSRFGPPADPRYWSDGEFLDIVPNRRIVSAGTMHNGNVATSVTLFTAEFLPDGDGTLLVLTDQSAFLDAAETPTARRSGWQTIVERLAQFLLSTEGNGHEAERG